MKILKCIVIDDEPLAAGLIASYIEKTPFTELAGTYSSAQAAIKTVLEGNIDVVFLDIQMPQLNGMEFAKIIPRTCRIIFTTAYDSYAVQGFKVNALDYLLKPVSYEEFISAVNKALEWFGGIQRQHDTILSEHRDHIIVKSEYKLIQIPLDKIIFIEGLKDYVKIYIDGEQRSVMTLMNMKSLEQALPSSRFMRVHRSFIVNKDRIKVIERNRIVFDNHQIPVSDTYKQTFNDYINRLSLSPRTDEE